MNITLTRGPRDHWSCDPVWFVWSLVLADRYGATAPDALPAWDPRRLDPWGISGVSWKFTDAEAMALADALEHALDDLPCVPSRLPSTNLLEMFGGDRAKCFLEAMAMFCRRGGFEVD